MKKVVLSFLILIVIGIGGYVGYLILYKSPTIFVTVDINPSVELIANSRGDVIKVISLNEDGDIISSDLNLVTLSLDEACEKIIEAANETGYLNEFSSNNAIKISTYVNNEPKRKVLETRIVKNLNEYLEKRKLYSLVVTEGLTKDVKRRAKSFGISYGKMLMIEKTVSLNETLNKYDLSLLSMKEIQDKIDKHNQARYSADNQDINKDKIMWKKEKETLKENYKASINKIKEQFWQERKAKNKAITENQKELIINEAVEQEKEDIKKAIEKEKDELRKAWQDIKEVEDDFEEIDENYPVIDDTYNKLRENWDQKNTGTRY